MSDTEQPVRIRLGEAEKAVKHGMKQTGLKKPEFIRQSIMLGAPALIRAFAEAKKRRASLFNE